MRTSRLNSVARLRAMTFAAAARAGYSFRWNNQRRCLELKKGANQWRSIREIAEIYEYTQRYFNRHFANLI